jgi:hypothetical protein
VTCIVALASSETCRRRRRVRRRVAKRIERRWIWRSSGDYYGRCEIGNTEAHIATTELLITANELTEITFRCARWKAAVTLRVSREIDQEKKDSIGKCPACGNSFPHAVADVHELFGRFFRLVPVGSVEFRVVLGGDWRPASGRADDCRHLRQQIDRGKV